MAPKGKKTRKPTRKSVRKAADVAYGKYIKLRRGANPRCFVCGSPDNLQCGHLFTRERLSTRWHPWNAEIQCAGCNIKHEHDPYMFFQKYTKKYGRLRIDELYRIHHTPIKLSNDDILEIAAHYNELVKKLEGKWLVLPFKEELPSQLYRIQSSTTGDFPNQT